MKTKIVSLQATAPSHMETEVEHHPTDTPSPDISELIADLKHNIVTIAIKMQAKFAQQEALKSPTPTKPKSTFVT